MSVAKPAATVCLGEGTEAFGCHLQHVVAGRDCRLVNSVVTGYEREPVVLGDRVSLVNCHVQVSDRVGGFEFAGWGVDQSATRLGDDVRFSHSFLLNTLVESGSRGVHAALEHSHVGPRNDLRAFTNMTRCRTAADCNLGSELSKTLILGPGFVSEHANTYLSLLAPADYPILAEGGREEVLAGLPNLTNIGAGTVFSNYDGEPLPASSVEQSPGSAKGTAVVYTSFVCINSRVVNRYGQPHGRPSPFDLLRRRDLTILGFASFVESKVTGRIPAFAYAGDASTTWAGYWPKSRASSSTSSPRCAACSATSRGACANSSKGPCASSAGSSRTSWPEPVPVSTPAINCRAAWPSCSRTSRTAAGP